jgi:glycosyltransferase involved in cell wall biosynthesis
MNADPIKILFVIFTYNRQRFLWKAVASIMRQDPSPFANFSLLVCDDGSTDNTPMYLDALDALKDDRIKTLRCKHGGISSIRNAALDFIAKLTDKPTYISWAGDDDTVGIKFFATHAAILHNDPSIDILYPNLIVNRDKAWSYKDYGTNILYLAKDTLATVENVVPDPGTFVRYSLYGQTGRYDPAFHVSSDSEYFIRMLPHLNNARSSAKQYQPGAEYHYSYSDMSVSRSNYDKDNSKRLILRFTDFSKHISRWPGFEKDIEAAKLKFAS